MSRIRGFAPISRSDAHTLILGSMPSRESLKQQRYYAHPRNAFWPIITNLLDIEAEDYDSRASQVMASGVAIWDVLKACFRNGSLDSEIDNSTLVTNDFLDFYRHHPQIERVFFNGAKAESVYLGHVLPGLCGAAAEPVLTRLPSTSPANAAMRFEQKLSAWRIIAG